MRTRGDAHLRAAREGVQCPHLPPQLVSSSDSTMQHRASETIKETMAHLPLHARAPRALLLADGAGAAAAEPVRARVLPHVLAIEELQHGPRASAPRRCTAPDYDCER